MRLTFEETLDQLFEVAVESVPIILFSITIVTLMMIVEFSFHMKMVLRQDSLVPAFSTLLMVRELGPVVTCLLLASRVGAGMSAEIATMKMTEQLDALELMGLSKFRTLVLPRLFACGLGAVVLTIVALAVGILLGATLASFQLNYLPAEFFSTMFTFTHFSDLAACLTKSLVFGLLIAVLACRSGFRSQLGSQGVGQAATQSVVQASLWIIGSDFLLTYLFYAV
jgi:phospholipid/cholesterol/gamma-HCH transport system permease protein